MVPMEKNTDKYTHSTPAAPPQLSHLGFPTRTSSLILVDKKPFENWTSQCINKENIVSKYHR